MDGIVPPAGENAREGGNGLGVVPAPEAAQEVHRHSCVHGGIDKSARPAEADEAGADTRAIEQAKPRERQALRTALTEVEEDVRDLKGAGRIHKRGPRLSRDRWSAGEEGAW